jgi:hypothetical protein
MPTAPAQRQVASSSKAMPFGSIMPSATISAVPSPGGGRRCRRRDLGKEVGGDLAG